MKTFYKLLNLLFILPLFIACSDDEKQEEQDPNISITISDFALGAEENLETTATFSITTNWTTKVSYEGTTKDWLTITPNSGKAGENIITTLKATKNTEPTTRKATVSIHYGEKVHTLTILQKRGQDKDITPAFDPKFATELQNREYIPDAKKIMISEVEIITKLDIAGTFDKKGALTSLQGIEYMTFLTELDCKYNLITTLDLEKNTALEELNCSDNELSSLNIDKNLLITTLDCRNNNITSLDVSKNTALVSLDCEWNELTNLDVSKNTALTKLMCSGTEISNLDVTKNIKLETLSCISNKLTSLDVSNNTALQQLECYYNYELSKIDVTKNTALISLSLGHNKITEIDLSKNTELVEFHCGGSAGLASLDISKNTKLTFLNAAGCALKTLDISNNKLLTSMYCSENPGESGKFIVKAWFDNSTIPSDNFTNKDWKFEGENIILEYKK